MLAKSREERFAGARELREAFEAAGMQRLAQEAARLGSAALPEMGAEIVRSAPVPSA